MASKNCDAERAVLAAEVGVHRSSHPLISALPVGDKIRYPIIVHCDTRDGILFHMDADYTLQRTKMVDGQLRTTDVTIVAILDAMSDIPRELFVPEEMRGLAYIDEDVRITPARGGASARYLMEPSPFAKLVQLAEVSPLDRVLDVGAGTGYSSAVLSRLAASVVALECDAELAAQAQNALASLSYTNVSVVTGPLDQGHLAHAPYDVIFVGGSVERVPEPLLAQLAEGGRLVVVEGRGNAGRAQLHLRSDGVLTGRNAFNAAIKPLPGFELAHAFEF